jgi:hypothetical protein
LFPDASAAQRLRQEDGDLERTHSDSCRYVRNFSHNSKENLVTVTRHLLFRLCKISSSWQVVGYLVILSGFHLVNLIWQVIILSTWLDCQLDLTIYSNLTSLSFGVPWSKHSKHPRPTSVIIWICHVVFIFVTSKYFSSIIFA